MKRNRVGECKMERYDKRERKNERKNEDLEMQEVLFI